MREAGSHSRSPYRVATINCDEFEWDAEPNEGVSLSSGEAWWGTRVKYRKLGARRWQHFNLVDSHSWDTEAIISAIDYQVTP